MDAASYHSAPLHSISSPVPHLSAISSSSNQYDSLLAEFPAITTPNFIQSPTKHGVEHFITTRGPPVHARARHLPPNKLAAARWKPWASYTGHPVPGHHHYTWCLKLRAVGALAGTTGASIKPPSPIGTQYLTFKKCSPCSV